MRAPATVGQSSSSNRRRLGLNLDCPAQHEPQFQPCFAPAGRWLMPISRTCSIGAERDLALVCRPPSPSGALRAISLPLTSPKLSVKQHPTLCNQQKSQIAKTNLTHLRGKKTAITKRVLFPASNLSDLNSKRNERRNRVGRSGKTAFWDRPVVLGRVPVRACEWLRNMVRFLTSCGTHKMADVNSVLLLPALTFVVRAKLSETGSIPREVLPSGSHTDSTL